MREKLEIETERILGLVFDRTFSMIQLSKNVGGRWFKVVRNKGRGIEAVRWDIWKNDLGGDKGEATTFFITDFEDKWRATDLFFELKEFGLTEEIVIPLKKDSRGLRYGFVRFIEVEDARIMEVKLDNVWLEGKKLKANMAFT